MSKGNPWHDIFDSFLELASRGAFYVVVTFCAIFGKMGWDYRKGRKRDLAYIAAFAATAIFASLIAGLICSYKHVDKELSYAICGASAMFCDKLLHAVMYADWSNIKDLNWIDAWQMLMNKKRE